MSIQRNVRQQNTLTFEAMLARAKHFRTHGVAAGIKTFFAMHGIDIDRAAVIWAHSESYMLGFEFGLLGMLVTAEKKFIRFELGLDSSQSVVVSVHEFADVTVEQNCSRHNKGTGIGEGAMSITVLEAINSV